jgi:hypothetical protein
MVIENKLEGRALTVGGFFIVDRSVTELKDGARVDQVSADLVGFVAHCDIFSVFIFQEQESMDGALTLYDRNRVREKKRGSESERDKSGDQVGCRAEPR